MTLRDATLADADAIAQLTTQLGYSADRKSISARLAKVSVRKDHLVLVAVQEEKVVGWLQAHASDVLESGFRVEIVGFIVDKNQRRGGVGRRLVERTEQWAKALDAETIVARSNTQRLESHRFYPALGFSNTKTQSVYRKVFPR